MTELIAIEADNGRAAAFLEPYFQSGNLNFLIGSGASAPSIKPAGNIENEINALLSANNEDEANKKSLEFITEIIKVNSRLRRRFGISPTSAHQKNLHAYVDFLQSIDRILFERKNILLARQANIFTTNYDLFLEYAANSIPGLILNDGFDRSSPVRTPTFAPERYFDRTYRSGTFYAHQIEIPTINLIKLHGSLSWRKRSRTVVTDSTPIDPLTPTDKEDPAKVSAFLAEHFIILPNFRKFHTTLMERTYYDLLRLFSRALDQQNVVLFSFGFSFADEHILDLTRRALRNPTAHLIIFSYDHLSANDYEQKFAEQRNVTILSPDSASVLDFVRLNKIFSSILKARADAIA